MIFYCLKSLHKVNMSLICSYTIPVRVVGATPCHASFLPYLAAAADSLKTPQRCLCHRDGEERSAMPRVRQLAAPDPLETEIVTEIAAGMAQARITIKDLALLTGINYSTLAKRIGKGGDIKTLRIGELIRIRKAIRRKVG